MANLHQPPFAGVLYRALLCLVVAVVFPLSGCATDIQLNSASPQSKSITLYVHKISGGWGGEEAVRRAVISSLTEAGYRVVEQSAEADIDVKVETVATQEQSFLQIQIGNERKISYKIQVTMALVSGAEVVDQVKNDFSTKGTAVDESAIKQLVNQITERGKIASYATTGIVKKKQQQAKLAAEQVAKQREKEDLERRKKEKEEQAAKDKLEQAKRQADERAWLDARVEDCRTPSRADSCAPLEKYIKDRPDGYHVEEARGILKSVASSLENLKKDEAEWASSGVDECRREQTKKSCAGVYIYTAKYPTGVHIREANQLLEGQ